MKLETIIGDGLPPESSDIVFDVDFPKWFKVKEHFVYLTLHKFEKIKEGEMAVSNEWTVIFLMKPADPKNIERHGLRPASRRTWVAMVLSWSAGSGAIELASIHGKGAGLLSRDPSKPGLWRFTRFDTQGPSGHSESADRYALLEGAYSDGFRRPGMGAVDELIGG